MIQGRSKEDGIKALDAASQARVAVQRLRQMTGTLKYMQDKDIADIFAREKNRIGVIIGHIDEQLTKTPRKSSPGVGKSFTWVKQDLQKEWNKYMDFTFEHARKRATDFMATWLKALKEEWESSKKTEVAKDFKGNAQAKQNKKKELEQTQKDILALVKKTEDEWDKVKDWKKPANWNEKDEEDTGDDGADQEDQEAAGQDAV